MVSVECQKNGPPYGLLITEITSTKLLSVQLQRYFRFKTIGIHLLINISRNLKNSLRFYNISQPTFTF